MSYNKGIVLGDLIAFCFGAFIYGIVMVALLGGLLFFLPNGMHIYNSMVADGDSSIKATLFRLMLCIVVGAPLGIKVNDNMKDIWKRFTS
jgi:hypothetical protein